MGKSGLWQRGMPGLSGYEVAQRLKETPQNEECYVNGYYRMGTTRESVKSTEAGIDHHVLKPIN
jgi:CheY-like chemotaxis protein